MNKQDRDLLVAMDELVMKDIRALFALGERLPRVARVLEAENQRRQERARRPVSVGWAACPYGCGDRGCRACYTGAVNNDA